MEDHPNRQEPCTNSCSGARTNTSCAFCSAHMTANVPSWGVRPSGDLCFINEAACQVFDVAAPEFLGRHWGDLRRHLELKSGETTEPEGGPEVVGSRLLRVPVTDGIAWFQITVMNQPGVDAPCCRIEAAFEVTRWVRMEAYVRGMAGDGNQRLCGGDYGLTVRERKVLEQLANGLTQQEIASRLFVSYTTVRTHVYRVLSKLGCSSIQGAVAKYLLELSA